jgi:hypothetical protein
LIAAGLTTDNYKLISSSDWVSLDPNACYTTITEPHFSTNNPNPYIATVRSFTANGGNFLSECSGVMVYQNGDFITTNGLTQNNVYVEILTHTHTQRERERA